MFMNPEGFPKYHVKNNGLSGAGQTYNSLALARHRKFSDRQQPAISNRLLKITGFAKACLFLGLAAWVLVSCGKAPEEPAPVAELPINPTEIKAKAEADDTTAQLQYGKLYANGDGVKRDYKVAASYYRLSADQGNAAAQVALGELFEAGQGVEHDFAEAARWYRKAAEQGYPRGEYALALMYLMGTGVPKDDGEALKWYRAAADHGYPLALFHLGVRYKNGQGVSPDPVEAFKWLSLAADRGITEAGEIRQEVQSRMTRAQVTEAKRRAAEFSAKLAAPAK